MIGGRLKSLRGKRTQEEIASHIGVSRARYSHYENGRSEPDYDTLQKLADYFQVTTDYLLTGKEKNLMMICFLIRTCGSHTGICRIFPRKASGRPLNLSTI